MIGFQVKRTILIGLKSLWLHKLRSGLTVLGMIFGVCSVIAMLAIGEGASYEAQEQIKLLGSTNIIIRAVKPPTGESASEETQRMLVYGLTYDDAERIATTIPSVQVMATERKIRKDVWRVDRRIDATIVGTVPWFPEIASRRVARGRFITSMDMHITANVCVLEPRIVEVLFPFNDPVGKTIKVGSEYYRVVGVMAPSGKEAQKKDAESGVVEKGEAELYIPLTSAKSRFGEITLSRGSGSTDIEEVELHEIIVRVDDLDLVVPTSRILRETLKRFHKKQDYEIIVPLEQLRTAQEIQRTYNIVLGSIAAISLLVGGIGIMNIMLATVTERTREIGIRRALGAKRADIIVQFLSETLLLSGTGGLFGVAAGILIPLAVERFADMRTIVTWWSLLVAFGISALVGVVFGIYPAYRAAYMDPIEALRHE